MALESIHVLRAQRGPPINTVMFPQENEDHAWEKLGHPWETLVSSTQSLPEACKLSRNMLDTGPKNQLPSLRRKLQSHS